MIALQMAPAERAARMTGREHLSYSSIATFQSCPLKWYFRYVVGLPEVTRSSNLAFGSAIHAALQGHFECLLADDRPPPLDHLARIYLDAWEMEAQEIFLAPGDTVQSLAHLAVNMLRAFQASELASPAGRVVAVEEELIGEISPRCPPLVARLDLVVETRDAVIITDFKTSRSRWSPYQVEDSATQLVIYRALADSLAGDKPIRLQFGVLTKTKKPSIESHPVDDDPRQDERVRAIVERVWEAIGAENFYPAPSPAQCGGCSFRAECRRWAG